MLTEASVEPLGLVLPVDAQVVDGDARQHDQQADATHQGLRVEGEDQQEAPEQQVDDGPRQTDLQDTPTFIIINKRVVTSLQAQGYLQGCGTWNLL